MRGFSLATVAAILILATSGQAAASCGDDVAASLYRADSWMKLARWYHEHPHCVDGALAEHVVTQSADWLSQPHPEYLKLSAAIAEHPEFELLLAWHLEGEYIGRETKESIRSKAEHQCPPKALGICAVIQRLTEK